MTLSFVKMHAHGDDFVIVDLRGKVDPITPEVARRLGDRNRGIGFNQLAAVLDCEDAAARLLFWNPDGSRLDTCGSATRGVAVWSGTIASHFLEGQALLPTTGAVV